MPKTAILEGRQRNPVIDIFAHQEMGGSGRGTDYLTYIWEKSEETNGITLDDFAMSEFDKFFQRIASFKDVLIINPPSLVVLDWKESCPQNFCRIPQLTPEHYIPGQRIPEQVITFLCTKVPHHSYFEIISGLTQLALSVFANLESLTFKITSDPELEDEEHLAINICLESSPDDALRAYTYFRKRLAEEFLPEVYRLLIVDLDLI